MGEGVEWKSLPEQKYPTTLGYILGGQARLEAGKEQGARVPERKEIGGRTWNGLGYQYHLSVPDIQDPQRSRFIEVKLWDPTEVNGDIELKAQTPRTQVEILVAAGWLPLTENPNEVDRVVQEIYGLLDERNKQVLNE